MTSDDKEKIVRGVVERVTFRNPENGYSVLQLQVPDKSERITVVGNCLEAGVGANVVVRGVFTTHSKFGKQLAANSITATRPSSVEGIERYLSSGLIKGVGAKTAERLVEEFGEETLETIHRHPEKIAKVKGVGKNRAKILSEAFAEQEESGETMQFLVEHNISPLLAYKIYEKFKSKTIEVISEDPYLLCRTIKGIGFLTADAIALNLGIAPDSPQRIKAGLYHALEKASDDGHCYLPKTILLQRSSQLLKLPPGEEFSEQLQVLLDEGFLTIRGDDAIFFKRFNQSEEFIAGFIASRCRPLESKELHAGETERLIRITEKELGISFTHEQKQAVHDSINFPLLIITGGPGCGKTTLTRAITAVHKAQHRSIALAAPTGRAAQRLSQVCGMEAKTIHRLLRYDPISKGFVHNLKDQLKQYDLIIIDESSMLDLMLAKSLFSAIPSTTTLILVGDKDQLPSVGPGKVFADLISVKEVKTISLSQLFRREKSSSINDIAFQINSGITPHFPSPEEGEFSDTYFIGKSDLEEAALAVEKLVSESIPKNFGLEPADICVLTPSNRGELGTERLNQRLQDCLNPLSKVGVDQQLEVNGTLFRLNDKVCQRVNNYQIDMHGVFNGDTGLIYSINKADKSLVVELWDGRLINYKTQDARQLSLAYAMTVHRSQGSEIPCVVLVLHDYHYTLLERQLIYTAVTRAKELLVVVGSKRALMTAARQTRALKRLTMLSDRIEEKVH